MSKRINVLNLSKSTSELQSFLESFNVNLVANDDKFTHILVSDLSELEEKHLGKKIISLTKPENYQSFFKQGGSLYLNPEWIDSDAGRQILTRYFQSEASTLFEENYPGYKKKDCFNISSVFSTGEYIDKLALAASEAGASALDIRTGFSHLLVYLSRLNDLSIAGLPFEISYGNSKKDFVLQAHFNAENVSVENIAEALDERTDRRIKSHGLFFAFQSCDLMELSYIESVKKLTISMHWLDSAYVTEPGLVLNMAINPVETKASNEFSIKPLLIQGEDIVYETLIETESDLLNADIEDDVVVIEGVTEIFKDESILVEDHSKLDDFVMKIKGKFEDIGKQDKTIVKGSGLDIDEVIYKIAGSVEEVVNDTKLDIRPLEKKMVKAIRSGLKEFSKTINIAAEDLTLEEIARFQVQKMPEIIRRELSQPISKDEVPEVVTLKGKVQSLSSEVKILKDSKKAIEEIRIKASKVPEEEKIEIRDVVYGMKNRNNIPDAELELVRIGLEKEFERRFRRVELEASKKEALFSLELEKAKHLTRIKDLVLVKTKDSFTKILNKKDQKLAAMKQKNDQLTSSASISSGSPLNTQIKELEKQNQHFAKQVEFYKNQVSTLATNMNSGKAEAEQKEEIRQLKMINQKLKSMFNLAKAELDQLKPNSPFSQPLVSDRRGEVEQELKRMQNQNQQLGNQLKESAQKIISLEAKMVELARAQQKGAGDDSSKVKLGQLEASVKKLTQDTIEAKNQVNDSKKEINRLRQEKTFLQNQLDKAKKEAEKVKNSAVKKGSKAA